MPLAKFRCRRIAIPHRRWATSMVVGVLILGGFAGPQAGLVIGGNERRANPRRTIVGFTRPQRTAVLGAEQRGRLARIHITEGATVAEGDILFELEDGAQAARTRIAQAESASMLEIELAKAQWDQAREEYERLTQLLGGEHAARKEIVDARVATQISGIEYELALFAKAQAQRQYAYQQKVLERYHIRAPFAGYVSAQHHEVGETIDETMGVLTLIQLHPLTIVVDCPVEWVSHVREGDVVRVNPVDTQWASRAGTIVMVNKSADGGSQTFKVAVRVENPAGDWMSGLKVTVDLDAGDDRLQPATSSALGAPEKARDNRGASLQTKENVAQR